MKALTLLVCTLVGLIAPFPAAGLPDRPFLLSDVSADLLVSPYNYPNDYTFDSQTRTDTSTASASAGNASAMATTNYGVSRAAAHAGAFGAFDVYESSRAESAWGDTWRLWSNNPAQTGNMFQATVRVHLTGTLSGTSDVQFYMEYDIYEDAYIHSPIKVQFSESGGPRSIDRFVAMTLPFLAGTVAPFDTVLEVSAGPDLATADFHSTAEITSIELPPGFMLEAESGTSYPVVNTAVVPNVPNLALFGASGGNASSAKLFTIDLATCGGGPVGCTATNVSANNIGFGLTGLAFHPATGDLYGSTQTNGSNRGNLASINPTTGVGTLIGSFGFSDGTLADLTFSAGGTLYGWASQFVPDPDPDPDGIRPPDQDLYSVNLATGAATWIGHSGIPAYIPGNGLAFAPDGRLLHSGTDGVLDVIDPATGAASGTVSLDTNVTFKALAFAPNGDLYGAAKNNGAKLYRIDVTTGAVTYLGPALIDGSETNADALAFGDACPDDPNKTAPGVCGCGTADTDCDPCPAHTDLGSDLPIVTTGDTATQSNELALATCGYGGDQGENSPDASFVWTAPATGWYQIDTCGSSFDTNLDVRDATCEGAELACNEDSGNVDCGTSTSRVVVSLARISRSSSSWTATMDSRGRSSCASARRSPRAPARGPISAATSRSPMRAIRPTSPMTWPWPRADLAVTTVNSRPTQASCGRPR